MGSAWAWGNIGECGRVGCKEVENRQQNVRGMMTRVALRCCASTTRYRVFVGGKEYTRTGFVSIFARSFGGFGFVVLVQALIFIPFLACLALFFLVGRDAGSGEYSRITEACLVRMGYHREPAAVAADPNICAADAT
jgi:hypothetical protein